MTKIFTAAQIRAADQYTIEHEPIASIDLMERASRAFVNWFVERFSKDRTVFIFCGTGNNGGDGLAIARLLYELDFKTAVFILGDTQEGSTDFKVNLDRLEKFRNSINIIEHINDLDSSLQPDLVIDGLFGSGLSRPLSGVYSEVIAALNEWQSTRISIDIASGLFADQSASGTIFKPDYTVCFQFPKQAFLLPENDDYVGDWHVVDIDLSSDFIDKEPTVSHYVDKVFVEPLFKSRKKFSHKGDFGKVLLIAGSKGKMGAAVLAARACLRAGAGLLTVYAPSCGLDVLQTAVPEAMALTDPNSDYLTELPSNLSNFDTIAIGPGIGQHKDTLVVLEQLLATVKSPIVLDADALNLISSKPELLEMIPKGSILTPHPREFLRLAGNFSNSFDRLEKQQQLAAKYNLNMLVKGAHSTMVSPTHQSFFNSTGNPGMATAGSGDVLTGVITGLLAQKYNPLTSLLLGVYLHGLSGDLASDQIGQNSLIASDMIDHLAIAISSLSK